MRIAIDFFGCRHLWNRDPKYEMLRMALSTIVDHARGKEWMHIFEGKFVQGLAGYEAWAGVMEARRADETGNAFNVAVFADAREYATRFLSELAFRWDGGNVVERTVRYRAEEAAKHYEEVATHLGELREMFPFPQGGTPKDPETADRAIKLIRQAHAAETRGIEQLEALFHFMKEYYSETWIN